MIKIPKKVALFLMIALTIVLSLLVRNIDWENADESLYSKIRLPLGIMSLVIFYTIYYVRILNQEKDASKK